MQSSTKNSPSVTHLPTQPPSNSLDYLYEAISLIETSKGITTVDQVPASKITPKCAPDAKCSNATSSKRTVATHGDSVTHRCELDRPEEAKKQTHSMAPLSVNTALDFDFSSKKYQSESTSQANSKTTKKMKACTQQSPSRKGNQTNGTHRQRKTTKHHLEQLMLERQFKMQQELARQQRQQQQHHQQSQPPRGVSYQPAVKSTPSRLEKAKQLARNLKMSEADSEESLSPATSCLNSPISPLSYYSSSPSFSAITPPQTPLQALTSMVQPLIQAADYHHIRNAHGHRRIDPNAIAADAYTQNIIAAVYSLIDTLNQTSRIACNQPSCDTSTSHSYMSPGPPPSTMQSNIRHHQQCSALHSSPARRQPATQPTRRKTSRQTAPLSLPSSPKRRARVSHFATSSAPTNNTTATSSSTAAKVDEHFMRSLGPLYFKLFQSSTSLPIGKSTLNTPPVPHSTAPAFFPAYCACDECRFSGEYGLASIPPCYNTCCQEETERVSDVECAESFLDYERNNSVDEEEEEEETEDSDDHQMHIDLTPCQSSPSERPSESFERESSMCLNRVDVCDVKA